MKENNLEILAPAGSFESLKAAVKAGADAVYMGGNRFGARAYAENPEGEQLLEAIDYAHLYGRKLYLTVNTLLKERELERELYDYLLPCYEHGLDAVIVQDFGVLQAVREWFPGLKIHASTQMTICGAGGVKFLEEAGASRVVLARELSLEEIQKIHKTSGAEIECFVHGALCYCYSGQCLFSSILGGRSGNRGRCAQPCRLSYEALEGNKTVTGRSLPLLSPKDICTIGLLPQIVEAGVCSLKIEGRMKRPEYTAGVVRIYRKYADWYLQHGKKGYQVSPEDQRELRLLFGRGGFSQGYYEQHNGKNMMVLSASHSSGSRLAEGEKKEYEKLLTSLRKQYVEEEQKLPVTGILYAEAGKPLRLELESQTADRQVKLDVCGDCPETAKNHPMETEQFRKQLSRTGNTPFYWEHLEIRMTGSLFVPVQSLNSLRRDALEQLRDAMVQSRYRSEAKTVCWEESGQSRADCPTEPVLHISVETADQLDVVLREAENLKAHPGASLQAVYLEAEFLEDLLAEAADRIHRKGLLAYVAFPAVFRMRTAGRYEKHADFWRKLPMDGCVIRNLETYEFLRQIGWEKERILDHNLYTFNRRCRQFWQEKGIRMQTNPLELNSRELREISDSGSIQVIYGRYPMMISAGCLHRTLDRCSRREGLWMLKDRCQKKFPVKNCCRDCYNIIYNSQPLYLLDQMEDLTRMNVFSFRMMFTTESAEETGRVLEDWKRGNPLQGDYTRGHFRRGVE